MRSSAYIFIPLGYQFWVKKSPRAPVTWHSLVTLSPTLPATTTKYVSVLCRHWNRPRLTKKCHLNPPSVTLELVGLYLGPCGHVVWGCLGLLLLVLESTSSIIDSPILIFSACLYQCMCISRRFSLSRLCLMRGRSCACPIMVLPIPFLLTLILSSCFPYFYYGYSVTDRTGTAQDYRLPLSSPPSHSHDVFNYSRSIVTTCLYTSALLSAELGSCLHP